jgi:hypothetical protein
VQSNLPQTCYDALLSCLFDPSRYEIEEILEELENEYYSSQYKIDPSQRKERLENGGSSNNNNYNMETETFRKTRSEMKSPGMPSLKLDDMNYSSPETFALNSPKGVRRRGDK